MIIEISVLTRTEGNGRRIIEGIYADKTKAEAERQQQRRRQRQQPAHGQTRRSSAALPSPAASEQSVLNQKTAL